MNQERKSWIKIHIDFAEKFCPENDKDYQQEWTEKGLTYWEAQIWIRAGFHPKDYYLIIRLKSQGYTYETAFQAKKRSNQSGQELSFEEIYLDISDKSLIGSKTIQGWPELQRINCSENKVTELFIIGCPNLVGLYACYNQLDSLDFLVGLVNLEYLDIGDNPLTGNLVPLRNLKNLKLLDIGNTGINSNLYLPENLEALYCDGELAEQLKNYKKDDYYDYQAWKSANDLHYLVEKGDLEGVKSIVNKFSEETLDRLINDEEQNRKLTLLHIAVTNAEKESYKEIIKFLLEKGVDPSKKNEYGSTPMHFAAQKGDLETLKLIFEKAKKIDIDAKNTFGWSLLHSAASSVGENSNCWEVIKWLLEKGASVKSEKNFPSVEDLLEEDEIEEYREILESLSIAVDDEKKEEGYIIQITQKNN